MRHQFGPGKNTWILVVERVEINVRLVAIAIVIAHAKRVSFIKFEKCLDFSRG